MKTRALRTTSLLGTLFLIALAALAAPVRAQPSLAGDPEPAVTEIRGEALAARRVDALRDRARGGPVRVIVGLASDDEPMAAVRSGRDVSARDQRARRRAVRRLRERLLRRMDGAMPGSGARSATCPSSPSRWAPRP